MTSRIHRFVGRRSTLCCLSSTRTHTSTSDSCCRRRRSRQRQCSPRSYSLSQFVYAHTNVRRSTALAPARAELFTTVSDACSFHSLVHALPTAVRRVGAETCGRGVCLPSSAASLVRSGSSRTVSDCHLQTSAGGSQSVGSSSSFVPRTTVRRGSTARPDE